MWSGPVVFDIGNDTGEETTVEIVKLATGSTFADLQTYIAAENERLAAGRNPLGEPEFVSVTAQFEVLPPSLEGGPLATELAPGRYAALCIVGYPLRAIHATAPLEVRGRQLMVQDDSCAYLGPRSVKTGRLSLQVDNRADDAVAVRLVRLADGRTVTDLEARIEAIQRTDEERGPENDPPWITTVGRTDVLGGELGTIERNIAAPGTYAFVCYVGVPSRIYPVAGFDATW